MQHALLYIRIKDYESSIFRDNNSAVFVEHSQHDSTCTYHSERHFRGCLKTQEADLSQYYSTVFST